MICYRGNTRSMPSDKPAIKVIDLVKHYKLRTRGRQKDFWRFFSMLSNSAPSVVALDRVNLEIPSGEIFGLLGPNGAGKTTLIKILSTLVHPDGGRAFVDGIDVVRSPKLALSRVQTVLAEARGLERRLTSRENLEFYATLYNIPRELAKKKIDNLFEFTHLADRAETPVQKLSTGNYRRLILARALLKEAPVVMLDEPTVGLDPVASSELRSMIKNDLAKTHGSTILLSTHNLPEAEQICDRIAVIQKGKIVAVGTPSEIRQATTDRTTLSIGLVASFPVWTPTILEKLRGISGVLSVDISENADGVLGLILQGGKGLDYNQVFETLSSLKLKVVSLEATRPSLESAFMKLMEEKKQPQDEVRTEVV